MILAAAEGHEGESGFHAPSIADFFPPAILFEGTPFELNRVMLVRFIAVAALMLVFVIAARRATVVPGRFQTAVEFVLEFCRKSIAFEILGEERGRKYVPIVTTIFCAILFFNLTGVIPGLNIAGTGVIGLPIVFALWVYITYLSAGVREHGVGGFLKNSLFPPGVPAPLYILLTPVEILQVFLLRPATLVIRLLANMIAGHLLLALCFAATHFLLLEAQGGMKVFGVVTFAGGFAFTLLELFVAVLQAYVFAILAAVYINMSVESEH
ncbi:F0F1 ATP synthase subunit A [Myceligenerans indicum]|uniref:ATP synthase subunit a n=1 Tax=Myceligenerans indicum TaxID=2593663 RepID=A0ABS1LHX9_9MICO|nr:F0F1 ATP synthase subunit A [Myceligenerans indicum]MBL0885826.1 F0F1 ATP synthase subunit A [Myceligenerans indicum]